MENRFLVTAANGHTGFTTAIELLNRGLSVRALVRDLNAPKAKLLNSKGAEIFRGNLDDCRDVEAALKDITRVYFCAPFDINTLLKTTNFMIAAEASGVEHVVYMNQWLASAAHPAVNTREQWLTKQLAKLHKTTNYTIINTGLFGFTYFFTIQMVSQLGIYPTLLNKDELVNKALNAPPSEEDQGRVIAAILADPEPHKSKTYRITGPELISHQDVINTYSKVLGRTISPKKINKKMMFKSLKAMGFDTYQFTNVTHYMDELEQGVFSAGESVNDVVFNITGNKPESFEIILRRKLERAGCQKRTLTGVAGATMFFIKMMFTKAPNLATYENQQNFPKFFKPPVLASRNPVWLKEHLPHGSYSLSADNKELDQSKQATKHSVLNASSDLF